MSTSRDLSPVERLMVYRTWGKRCVWCKRPITFRSLEIDHLIPKSLAGEELDRALADYGLPASFDIYVLPNLVPSCRPCNGSKGDRPVRGAPVVVAVLDKAQQRAPKIWERAAEFNRSRALDEVTALLHAIQPTADRRPPTADRRPPTADRRPPTADEMKSLNELVEVVRRSHLAFTCYEPDPPKLKRSKNRLGYNGLSDKRQMLMMLESWVTSNKDLALDVVQDTFDGGDTPPQHVWLTSVNFLAYAKELGDFLANVTFNIDYLFVTEDSSGPADAEHDVDLWITLDPTKRNVVDMVPDNLNTLHLCDGYK